MPFPLDRTFVTAAEVALGASLPSDYVEAMMGTNGGVVATDDDEWMLYPIADESDRKRLARTANHIVRETNAWRSWDGVPEGAVCVGDNGSGDRLIFLRDGDRFGPRVHWWSHESGEVFLAAASFALLARIE